jgi:hypothetical protein
VLVLAWITLAIRHRYYLHMHHWFLALLMTPLTQTGSPLLTLIAVGFCAAQFVEGASKWCVLPATVYVVSLFALSRLRHVVCVLGSRVRFPPPPHPPGPH